jgi:type IV pilus assembly protein PilM
VPILKNVLGLDLGSHSLKAVELQQGLRSLEAVHVRSVPRDEPRPLPEVLRRFVDVHRLATDHVVTALRGDRLSVRRLEFPFTERRRLAQAVPFEVEDTLPFELDQVLLDWQPVQSERGRSRVVAAIAPRARVSELIDSLSEAGCNPRTVEAEGLVLANLCGAFELGGPRLLVDIGHAKTTFCALYEEKPVAAHSFGVAGRAITDAIAEDRGLSLAEAERAKCEHGVFDPVLGGRLAKAAAVIDQIAGEMVRFLASLESSLPVRIEDVTLFGGSSQLERIDELLAERTGLSVSRLGLPRDELGPGLVAGGSPLVFAPAIALALRGTARAQTSLNFRQDEFAHRVDLSRYRRDFGSTLVLAGIVVALAIASALSGALLESGTASRSQDAVAELWSGAFPDRPLPENPVAAMREAVQEAHARAEFLGVYRGNRSALDLLGEISKRVPPDLDVVFEELSIDRQTIRIRAFTKSFEAAERLGAELAKFEPFAKVQVGSIETDRRSDLKRFNVTIGLEEDAS